MGVLKLALIYTPACHIIISSHKVSNEITSTASETEQVEGCLLWVSLPPLIVFNLTRICPLCVGLVFSPRFWTPGKQVSYLINHHECAWHIVGTYYYVVGSYLKKLKKVVFLARETVLQYCSLVHSMLCLEPRGSQETDSSFLREPQCSCIMSVRTPPKGWNNAEVGRRPDEFSMQNDLCYKALPPPATFKKFLPGGHFLFTCEGIILTGSLREWRDDLSNGVLNNSLFWCRWGSVLVLEGRLLTG